VTESLGIPEVGQNSGRKFRWVALVIGAAVIVLIVWRLSGTLMESLNEPVSPCDYEGPGCTPGPILTTVIPVLVATMVLLIFVAVFYPREKPK